MPKIVLVQSPSGWGKLADYTIYSSDPNVEIVVVNHIIPNYNDTYPLETQPLYNLPTETVEALRNADLLKERTNS